MFKIVFFCILTSLTANAVIHGQQADQGEMPASVFVQEAHCSAVVIRDDILLFAGHCLNSRADEALLLEGFRLKIVRHDEGKSYDVTIAKAQSHPSWIQALKKTNNDPNAAMTVDDDTLDLAFIQLNEKLPITPVKLPIRARTFSDLSETKLRVTGFGCEAEGDIPTETLKYFEAPVMYATGGKWRYRFQSAKICGGDSGSAVYNANDIEELLGINSGETASLGLAARVDSVQAQAWLKKLMKRPHSTLTPW